MTKNKKGLTLDVGVNVKGKDKLQDLADVLREVSERVVIRDNETVNLYMSTNVFAPEAGGDDD